MYSLKKSSRFLPTTKFKKSLIITTLFSALISPLSYSSDVNNDSIKQLTTEAEQGSAQAQYQLGLMYITDDGKERSYEEDQERREEGEKWLTKAAEQGDPAAQYELARLIAKDKWILSDEDEKKYIELMTKAAEQGHLEAKYTLAKRNNDFRSYKELAEQGHKGAQNDLVRIHLRLGHYEDAMRYLAQARNNDKYLTIFSEASKGNADAQYELGVYAASIEEYTAAEDWFIKAAEQGMPEAQFALAIFYYDDNNNFNLKSETKSGVARESSVYWMDKAAKQNFPWALYYMGDFVLDEKDGYKGHITNKLALKYITMAANAGVIDAQEWLGDYYKSDDKGKGNNMSKAIYWKEKVIEGPVVDEKMKEFMPVLSRINWSYRKDYDLNIKLTIIQSKLDLARIYRDGKRVKKDERKARQYYASACLDNNGKKLNFDYGDMFNRYDPCDDADEEFNQQK